MVGLCSIMMSCQQHGNSNPQVIVAKQSLLKLTRNSQNRSPNMGSQLLHHAS